MVKHPANLLLRFVLEIVGLVTVAQWAWIQIEGWQKYLLGFGVPVAWAIVWGVFGTPGDPIRNKKPPVAIPGRIRLGLETFLFLIVIAFMFNMESIFLAIFYGFALVLNYFWSAERLVWLLKN